MSTKIPLTLQDGMSPVLRNVMKSMSSMMRTMDLMNKGASKNQISKSMSVAERSIKAADNSIKKLNNTQKLVESSSKKVGSSFSGWSKGIIVANQALNLIKSTMGQFVDLNSAFNRMDTMTNFDRTMTAVIGDSNKANQMLETLKDQTKGTAYGLDVAAKSAQNFVTRGLSPDQATTQVKTWMDAVSFYGEGTNEQLESVTNTIGKILSKGRVDQTYLDSLTDAGINAVQIYADATGQLANKVSGDLSDGKIGAQQFVSTVTQAMQEGTNGVLNIADSAKKAGNTWATTIANVKAAGTRGLISMIDSINRALENSGLPSLQEMLIKFGDKLEEILTKAGNVIGWIVTKLSEIGGWVSENWDIIKPILIAIITFLAIIKIATIAWGVVQAVVNAIAAANPIGLILMAILAIVIFVIYAFIQWSDVVAKVIGSIVGAVFWMGSLLKNIGFGIANFFIMCTEWIVNKFWEAIYGLELAFYNLKKFVLTIVYAIIRGVQGIIDWVLGGLSSLINGAIGGLNKLIGLANKIPGVEISTIGEVDFKTEGKWGSGILEEINSMTEPIQKTVEFSRLEYDNLGESFDKGYSIGSDFSYGVSDKLQGIAEKATGFLDGLTKYGEDEGAKNPYEHEPYIPDYGGIGDVLEDSKLGSVGKIDNAVEIKDEDLKYLKDIAKIEYVNRYVQSKPILNVSFGDVHETADTKKIAETLADMVEKSYASSLV